MRRRARRGPGAREFGLTARAALHDGAHGWPCAVDRNQQSRLAQSIQPEAAQVWWDTAVLKISDRVKAVVGADLQQSLQSDSRLLPPARERGGDRDGRMA